MRSYLQHNYFIIFLNYFFNTITLICYILLLNVTICLQGIQGFEILVHLWIPLILCFSPHKICLKSVLIEKHHVIYYFSYPTQGLHHFNSVIQTMMSALSLVSFILDIILDTYIPKICYFIVFVPYFSWHEVQSYHLEIQEFQTELYYL